MNLIRLQQPSVQWPAFERLSNLREEMDRLFEAPLAGLVRSSNFLSGWSPALDVYEDKDTYTVKAELPGMKKEEINVSLQEGTLSIFGERKAENKYEGAEVYRAERYVGRFQRSVLLPGSVAVDKISAKYKDGVLTVTLPKTEESKPKQIDVSVN